MCKVIVSLRIFSIKQAKSVQFGRIKGVLESDKVLFMTGWARKSLEVSASKRRVAEADFLGVVLVLTPGCVQILHCKLADQEARINCAPCTRCSLVRFRPWLW